MNRRTTPAALPPSGLPGLDPAWSRLVTVLDGNGVSREFHVLDNWIDRVGEQPIGTLLCVHGNPTWSYLWRRLLAAAPPGWRVVAPDHLGMGYSERPDRPRVLDQRVDDLCRLTDALMMPGPVVTVAHDWGGILSLGWALRHRDQLRGVVLTNTAVHQPGTSAGPPLIRLAHHPLINRIAVRQTGLFVRTTTALTWPVLPGSVRAAFAAPYRRSRDRRAVSEFVSDIPFADGHPSRSAIDAIADALPGLQVPVLLLWGPRDPVFREEHLRDLQERLPHAALHRYERASHLLPEDAPGYPGVIAAWLDTLTSSTGRPAPETDLLSGPGGYAPARVIVAQQTPQPGVLDALAARADDPSIAVVEVGGASITWVELHRRVCATAAGLTRAGVEPGDRVALLIPPSIDLTVALYAVWQAGAVIVVADKGLGLRGMGRALRSARLDHLISETTGLVAAGVMRLPGTRIAVRRVSRLLTRAQYSLDELAPPGSRTAETSARLAAELTPTSRNGMGRTTPATETPLAGIGGATRADPEAEAAVLFTSGATGPAKGVRYRHRQVQAQLALIRATYQLTADDRIVAAFAPFALYGPALGIPSSVPDSDVTKPGSLTASALADAAAGIGATVVFASPAALRNVLATAAELTAGQRVSLATVRLLMSAGAPVPAPLLRQLQAVLPAASMHTPYGMTEALPITDISLDEIEAAGAGDGVCVGRPLNGVEVRVAPLDGRRVGAGAPTTPVSGQLTGGAGGRPTATIGELNTGDELTATPGVTGEIWVRAAHIRDSYDALWATDQLAAAHPGWHRTGDVGALDEHGRLWIQGRTVHVISTASGPVTPVGLEQRIQAAIVGTQGFESTAVAVVGVGPAGIQQVVVVLTGAGGPLAPGVVTDVVRAAAAGQDIAAVLVAARLPVDIRHNSKIDRTAVAAWASTVLAGR